MPRGSGLAWVQLPLVAQAYVVLVGCAGAFALVRSLPQTFNQPLLFAGLLTAACFTSLWKVNLPLPLTSGSTLSVSYAADLMALLLLGPKHAVVIAVAGVLAQCTHQGQGPVSGVSHAVQHGGGSDHDDGDRARVYEPGGAVGAGAVRSPREAAGRSDHHLLHRQHRPGRRRDRRVDRAVVVEECGATTFSGAAPASWSRARPARSRRSSLRGASTGRPC